MTNTFQQGSTLHHRELYPISCDKPRWKRLWKRKKYTCVCVCMYNWGTLLYRKNQLNIVDQLCVCVIRCQVLINSLWSPCSLPGSSVHGVFPGKGPGMGCHFLLPGSSGPRDQTCVSCVSYIGRWVLYHCAATWEAQINYTSIKFKKKNLFLI